MLDSGFPGCTFCAEFADREASEFKCVCPAILDRTVLSTPRFRVVAGLGAFRAPYFLVVPVRHVLSFAALTRAELLEADEVLTVLLAKFAYAGVRLVNFEHGSSGSNPSGGCIAHAHLHVMASDVYLRKDLQSEFKTVDVSMLSTLSDLAHGVSYLYWHEPEASPIFIETESIRLPSQYFRRCIAAKTNGVDVWDWAVQPACDLVVKTLDMWSRLGRT